MVFVVVVVYLSIFLHVRRWQHQKGSNSARFPQFSNLTTSKSKQFCETSFEVDSTKNEAILRDVLQKCEVECKAAGLVPVRFAIFPLHLSKVLRLPCKNEARLYEALHLSRKIILANLKIRCSKMQPLSWNQRPDLLTSLMSMSLVPPAARNASLQILFECPTPAIVFGNATKSSRFAHFWQGAESLAPATPGHILTSKSAPRMVCFVHFDFEMCFAPQRRVLFRHVNFQKWSENGVFSTFWLGHVLRATTACTFSTFQLPKVLWTRQFLTLLTSKCASRHNGVHFFDICTSTSALRLRCFVHFDFQTCFAPQRCALFWYLNFQKCSLNVVCFVHFDLEMRFAPQRRAIFHLLSGQLAPHLPL